MDTVIRHLVSFPGLGLDFSLNPVAFNLFGKDVYWYGLIIAFGFLLATLYASVRAKQFGLTADNIIDMLIFATVSGVIGARLYYVVFNFSLYRDDPLSVLYIWQGGLAIYGGIIFAVLAVAIFSRMKKINLWRFLDVGALGLLIGQAVGRWGNFMNAEAYGKAISPSADGSYPFWAMRIGGEAGGFTVYPNFLFESLWNVLGFILLHFYSKKRKFGGEIFLLYIAWYGIGRSLVESLRGGDTLYLFSTGIPVSILFGALSAAAAIILLLYKYSSKKRGPFGLGALITEKGLTFDERLARLYPEKTASVVPAAAEGAFQTETDRGPVIDEPSVYNEIVADLDTSAAAEAQTEEEKDEKEQSRGDDH